MISRSFLWLPDSAYVDTKVEQVFDKAIAGWNMAWFPDAHAVERKGRPVLEDLGTGQETSAERNGGVEIDASPKARQDIVDLVLDMRSTRRTANSFDAEVLKDFEARLFDDLSRRISEGLGAIDAPAADRCVAVQIFVRAGGESFRIMVGASAVAAYRVSAASRDESRTDRFGSLAEAIGATSACISADLGSVRLTLEELDDLEPGDLVRFDRPVAEGICIRIAGLRHAFARGQIVESNASLRLAIEI